MARKSTGKRLRFKVFERDNFTCQYCGKKPPEVILHADHIYPVSKGGKNELENLITACADCNLGKASMELGAQPIQAKKNAEDLQERYDQLRAFYELQGRIDAVRDEAVEDICFHWEEIFNGNSITAFGRASFKNLLKKYSPSDIKDAIDIMATRGIRDDGRENRFRYVCGILKNKRRTNEI